MPEEPQIKDHTQILNKPIVLIGIMGVGKTTVGRALGRALGCKFKDSDKIIEEKAGRTIPQVFEEFGEARFRQSERRTIEEVLAGDPCVLATGGGAVCNPQTRDAMKQQATSVWLKADVDTIMRNVSKSQNRPLLKTGNPEETIKNLLQEREAFYAQADIHYEMKNNSVEAIVADLIQRLHEHAQKGAYNG